MNVAVPMTEHRVAKIGGRGQAARAAVALKTGQRKELRLQSDAKFQSWRMGSTKEQTQVRSGGEVSRPLLDEIGRLGGEEKMKGAAGAMEDFETVLKKLVEENPAAFGAGEDAESQARVISELIESVRAPFLAQTVTSLRTKAGYVKVLGCWVHRAVFTFVGFGMLAALVLPLCAVSLMSTSAWGWLPGAVGAVLLLGVGVWILSRVRNK